MSWKGESRRHSLARKGVKTNVDNRRQFDNSKLIGEGVYNKRTYLNIFTNHIKNLRVEDAIMLRDIMESRLINALFDHQYRKTNNYPSRSEQKRIHQKIQLMDMDELVENLQKYQNYGTSNIYKVKDHAEYLIDIEKQSTDIVHLGNTKKLRWGDTLVYIQGSPDNTAWVIHKGLIGKHNYGAYGGIDKDPNLERMLIRDD